MSTIATAYVQVLPSTKGIKNELSNQFSGVGNSVGKEMGGNITSSLMGSIGKGALVAVGTAAVAGIAKGINASVKEGGSLQQSIGGIQTLFKNSAGTVMHNASEAWKTAGLSANEYMEQTTSFGASLIKSLGGDTRKAAKIADVAITDMSDNSNKFGTNIESIQNAYQGFAKGNFTMLDNLKLGYGGTRSEMEKLLQDASKISGIKFKIDSFADIITAIHTIQNELKVTGTTAEEASSTLSGSFKAVKAAASNVLGGMSLGGDISSQLDNLGSAFQTFFNDNLLPMIDNAVSNLPDVFSKLIEGLSGDGAADAVSKMATIGIKLAKAIIGGLGELGAAMPLIVMKMAEGLAEAAPELAKAIPDLIKGLAEGIAKYGPEIAKEMPKLVMAMAEALIKSAYYLIEGLGTAIYQMIESIPAYATDCAAAFQSWGSTISSAFQGLGSEIMAAISPAVSGIADAFGPALSSIGAKLSPLVSSFQNMFSQIGSFASACAGAVGAVFAPVGQKIGSIFRSAVGTIKSAFAPIGSFMQQVGQQMISALSSAVAQFRSIGRQMIENLKSGISGAVGGLLSDLKNKVDAIANLFKNLADKVNNFTKSITSSATSSQKATQTASSAASSSTSRSYAAPVIVDTPASSVQSYSAPQPVNVNVTLSGSAKNIFDSVQVENTKLVTATGYHALA